VHTVTLKTDDGFYNLLTETAKNLGTSKSALIREAVLKFHEDLEQRRLQKQIEAAVAKTKEADQEENLIWEGTLTDGVA